MKIQSVNFSADNVVVGGNLAITAILHNDGAAPATGQGPFSGFTYAQTDSFRDLGYPGITGDFRLVAGIVPTLAYSLQQFPYRWGFQGTVAPGNNVTVVGNIKIDVPTPFLLYVSLVQQTATGQVFVMDEHAFTQVVTIGTPQPADITALQAQVNSLQTNLNNLTNAYNAFVADIHKA